MDESHKLAVAAAELVTDGKDVTKQCSQILASITELVKDVESPEFLSNVADFRASIDSLKEVLGDVKAGLSEADEIQSDSKDSPAIERKLSKVNKVLVSGTHFLETALEILHKFETIGLGVKEQDEVQELLLEVMDNVPALNYNLLDMQDGLNNVDSNAELNKTDKDKTEHRKTAPPPPGTKSPPTPVPRTAPTSPTPTAKAKTPPPVPPQPKRVPPATPVNTASTKEKEMEDNSSKLKEWTWNDQDGEDEKPGCWDKFRSCFCGANRYSM